MVIRRYSTLKQSRGTEIPPSVRATVYARDHQCVGRAAGFPGDCFGGLELDHVRASGAIGMKSATVPANLVLLCSAHHRYKTEHGREVRPLLVSYIDAAMERSGTIG